jgi:hypothetical protein
MPGPALAKLEGATTVSCRWGRGRSDEDELAPPTTLLFFPAGCVPLLPQRDPLLGRCTPLLPKLFGTIRMHSSLSWGRAHRLLLELLRPLLSFLLAPWRLPLFCRMRGQGAKVYILPKSIFTSAGAEFFAQMTH